MGDTSNGAARIEGDRTVMNRSGFRTPPEAGKSVPVRFVLWGDSGAANDGQRACKIDRRIPIYPETGNHDYETDDAMGAEFESVVVQP